MPRMTGRNFLFELVLVFTGLSLSTDEVICFKNKYACSGSLLLIFYSIFVLVKLHWLLRHISDIRGKHSLKMMEKSWRRIVEGLFPQNQPLEEEGMYFVIWAYIHTRAAHLVCQYCHYLKTNLSLYSNSYVTLIQIKVHSEPDLNSVYL